MIKRVATTLLLLFLASCAMGADSARKVVAVGLHTLAATADVMGEVDKAKIAAAKTSADLDKWEAQFNTIMQALNGSWASLRALADGVTATEAGVKSKNYVGMVAEFYATLAKLAAALTDAGIKVPGLG